MQNSLKIGHRENSGHLRPHEHTSYIPLAFIVMVVGVILVGYSLLTVGRASAGDPPPQAGSIGLSGEVPTTPPKVAATITSPTNGQRFSTSPVTVSGSCPTGTLVEIFKNQIFAGSTPCTTAGTYKIDVDMLYGANSLTAQVFDDLNQEGPVSNAVNIVYDATPPASASLDLLNFSGAQLVLDTDAVYRGTFPGQMLNVPVTIIGGTAPYAVNVVWGDASNKVIPRGNTQIFNASHSYQKPGTYEITLQGTDSQQQVAFLTVAAIVNGQPASANGGSTSGGSKGGLNKLLVLWPLYAVTATLVVSFWMGETREKKILKITSSQIHPPSGIIPQNPA